MAKKKSSRKQPAKSAGPVAPRNPKDLKYFLYERSVQSPDWHVQHLPRFLQWMTGRKAKRLREDFCGTARISCEWARSAPDRAAVGLDLDPEPISYYERFNRPQLTADQASRVRVLEQDVLKRTSERFDLIAACNFSFLLFRDRPSLLRYFRSALEGLAPGGALFLEVAGGEGMREPIEEGRNVSIPGYGRIRYVWEQDEYDPISGVNQYAIHFRKPDGKWMREAFHYRWRLWGIRDLREALAEAGFDRSYVFWEGTDRDGEGTGEYAPMESGDYAHSWIAYVVGVRRGKSEPKFGRRLETR